MRPMKNPLNSPLPHLCCEIFLSMPSFNIIIKLYREKGRKGTRGCRKLLYHRSSSRYMNIFRILKENKNIAIDCWLLTQTTRA